MKNTAEPAPPARRCCPLQRGWQPHEVGKPGGEPKAWWPWAKRVVVSGFLLFVAALLIVQARAIEWREVFDAIGAYPSAVLLTAATLSAASHLIYSSFDLVGRRYTGHALRAPTVMGITFVSYAFNLNLGTLVGAVGMRARLYSRLGLEAATITRVVGTSMLTNWLGYFLLAGLAFLWWPLALPADWHIGVGALQALGGALVAVALGYLALCAFSRRREWTVAGHEIGLPGLRLAGIQLVISIANWAVMGAIMDVLLQDKVGYPTALSVLLTGAVAGLLSRVPAGLGVLEGVFVALLAPPLSNTTLIAAVLMYRAVYYWAPLAVATLLYLAMEANARKLAAAAA
ncbi:Inner membrane protein YbhN [Variovorax sp. SRS16]|nr:Inner membrane protein YbhN [Variovorax sp. SRS16]